MVFLVNVGLETITVVEGQWAYRAREIYSAGAPRTARIEVHAVDVLLQTVGVQVHVVAERTPDVGVRVQFSALGRGTDARRRARGRVDVPLGYVVRQFVLRQKKFAANLADRLRSRRHSSAVPTTKWRASDGMTITKMKRDEMENGQYSKTENCNKGPVASRDAPVRFNEMILNLDTYSFYSS